MFEIMNYPTIIAVRNDKYYPYHSRVLHFDEFIKFTEGDYVRSDFLPLPQQKNVFEKMWFMNKSALDLGVAILDYMGLGFIEYSSKVWFILCVISLPLLYVAIRYIKYITTPRIPIERKREIFECMRERIKKKRQDNPPKFDEMFEDDETDKE